jgi:hypothetical protein
LLFIKWLWITNFISTIFPMNQVSYLIYLTHMKPLIFKACNILNFHRLWTVGMRQRWILETILRVSNFPCLLDDKPSPSFCCQFVYQNFGALSFENVYFTCPPCLHFFLYYLFIKQWIWQKKSFWNQRIKFAINCRSLLKDYKIVCGSNVMVQETSFICQMRRKIITAWTI